MCWLGLGFGKDFSEGLLSLGGRYGNGEGLERDREPPVETDDGREVVGFESHRRLQPRACDKMGTGDGNVGGSSGSHVWMT